jgi:hypothetical protein
MDTLQALSLATGAAWASGINLYATVAALGIAGRTEMINLPPDLQVLTHPAVIVVACVMYLIEFFADKVPYVDNGWDVIHTFIRVPAGAILAARALGDVNPALELAAVLAGGTIAFAAHGTKTATRLAINTSPEPFSNWLASIGEDLAVFGSIWMIFHYPILVLIFIVCFLALIVWLIPTLLRMAKRGLQALHDRLRGIKPDQPAPTGSPQPG